MKTLKSIAVNGGYVVRHSSSGQYIRRQVAGGPFTGPLYPNWMPATCITAELTADIAQAQIFPTLAHVQSCDEFQAFEIQGAVRMGY